MSEFITATANPVPRVVHLLLYYATRNFYLLHYYVLRNILEWILIIRRKPASGFALPSAGPAKGSPQSRALLRNRSQSDDGDPLRIMQRTSLQIVKLNINSAASMSNDDGESLNDLGCDLLEKSGDAQVAIWRPKGAEWQAFEDKTQGRFGRIMQMWCNGHRLTTEMFNGNEGRSSAGTMLMAFKAFKIRLYGFVRNVQGVKTFIVVDVDPAKKQDKADPGILKRAYGQLDRMNAEKRK